MNDGPQGGTLAEYLKRSTLIWLAVLLFAATVLTGLFYPLKYVRYNKLTPQHVAEIALSYKNSQLASQPCAPDVMLLGSSLMMSAVKYCDTKYTPDTTWAKDASMLKLSDFQGYTQARYLEALLSKKLARAVTVFNFTSAACMVSDASLILNRAIEEGKAPKVVLYGIAPRDFVDNLVPDLGRTPAFDTLANWQCLTQVLPAQIGDAKVSKDSLRDLVLSAMWPFYKEKSNFRTLFADVAGKYFSHPTSLAEAEKMEAADLPSVVATSELPATSPGQTKLANKQFDGFAADHIIDYKHRYNPANYDRFAQEADQFAKLLSVCRQNGIELVVINMPITAMNKSLMPSGMYDRYKQNVSWLTNKYGAVFVDLDQANVFQRQDFLDSVHTNPDGGKKVLDQLFSKLSANHALDCLHAGKTKLATGANKYY